MAITNKTKGPRYVNTTTGAYLLQPGATLPEDMEVSDAEMAAMERTGHLGGDVEAEGPVDPAIGNRSTDPAAGFNLGNLGGAAMGTGEAGPAGAETAEQLVDGNNKDQLLEIAKTEGAEVADGATKAEIAEAIVANRAK